MRRIAHRPAAAFVALCIVLAACAPAAAPSPTQAPVEPPTTAPIATPLPPSPEPTLAPTATATAAPTPLPTRQPGPVDITFWYGYSPGAAEELALMNIVKRVRTELPDVTVHLLRVPFSELYGRYEEAVKAGEGPDMFLAPNDSLGNEARQGLLADITDLAAGKLDGYDPRAIDGMSLDGRLYGIPESSKAVVLWYNKSLLPSPPATTDDLKALMEGGTPVGLIYSCYYSFGLYGSFGGKLFDSNWHFTADQGGFAQGAAYLQDLYKISTVNKWPTDEGSGVNRFRLGKIVAITNGNWAMGDYRSALGSKLAVAPLPAGPNGDPATPFLGQDGFYVNPNSKYQDVAVDVALHFTNAVSQKEWMDRAGHVPVRTDVEITDPLIRGLVEAFKTAYVRPQAPQMDRYWASFCNTNDLFQGDAPAADWVKIANDSANK